jgi:hypothetical protein
MESVLLKMPENILLDEYFKTLDIFDRRTLLNEFEDVKNGFDKKAKRLKLLLFFSILSIITLFPHIDNNIYIIVYFVIINIIMLISIIRNTNRSYKFRIVIDKLKKMM